MIAFTRFELILYRIFGGLFIALIFSGLVTGQRTDSFPVLFAIMPTFYLFMSTLVVMALSRVVRGVAGAGEEIEHMTALIHLAIIVVGAAIGLASIYGVRG